MTNSPRYLNIADLCQRYNVARRTVYYWIESGKLSAPDVKAFGSPRWNEDTVKKDMIRAGIDPVESA